MHFPNCWVRVFKVGLSAVIMTAAVACSSSGQSEESAAIATETVTATATATPITSDTFPATVTPTRPSAVEPYPTRPPLPPTPPPMQVIYVDDFGPQVTGSVYEDLLARMPDNDITRTYTKLTDFAGMLELLGLEKFPLGATEEEIETAALEMVRADLGGFKAGLPGWPGERSFTSGFSSLYPYLGFDIWNVDQSAHAIDRFTRSEDREGINRSYDVAFGPFDPAKTAESLAVCDCDQPTIQIHDGVGYYTWGEGGVGDLRKRYDPPAYDHIGRGPRLLIQDGAAYWTIHNSTMNEFIDLQSGEFSSLAESRKHLDAVRHLLSLGAMRDIIIRSSKMSLHELDSNIFNDDRSYTENATEAPLLKPFEIAAEGVGYDGLRAFTGIVLGHSDRINAELNAELLVDRMWNVRRQNSVPEKWAELMERVEIKVEGSAVLVRIYYVHPEIHSHGFSIIEFETLIVHE